MPTQGGIASELPVGTDNGINADSVVNLDEVRTIPRENLGKF